MQEWYKRFYKAWFENRRLVEGAALGLGAIASFPRWAELFGQGTIRTDCPKLAALQLAAPGVAWLGAQVALAACAVIGDEDAGGHAVVRRLKDEIAKDAQPVVDVQGVARAKVSLGDVAVGLAFLDSDAASPLWRQAKKSKNPHLALRASMRYFARKEYDIGLDCLRESLDWMNGKQVIPPRSAYLMGGVISLAERAYFGIVPRSVEGYMTAAARRAQIEPQECWKYSELGRRVADTFSHRLRKEMYIFHALLASAQRRSDAQDAWRDALNLLVAESGVESASERESRSEVFRFDGNFFANTLVVKRRPDLESLAREFDWQRMGREKVSACDVPEGLYVSREEDGLSCLALRYRKGDLVYDLLERGDKSAVPHVARGLGQIHARVPIDGLPRLDIGKKARDKLYDGKLGLPREFSDAILANYGAVERACWRAPAVINKDAHPEQWILGERMTAIDWEIDAAVPMSFDQANFVVYRPFFSPSEQRAFVGDHVAAYKQEGGDVRGEDVFISFYNAVIHRGICFLGAWSDSKRKSMRQYRGEMVGTMVHAVDSLRSECASFYEGHRQEYERLRELFVRMGDLIAP